MATTYLERFVDSTYALPPEITRLLSLLKDLDETIRRGQAKAARLTEDITRLPSQASKAPDDQLPEYKRLKRELDNEHALLTQFATEKTRVATLSIEMLQSHLGRLDKDLIVFAEELASQAREQHAAESHKAEGLGGGRAAWGHGGGYGGGGGATGAGMRQRSASAAAAAAAQQEAYLDEYVPPQPKQRAPPAAAWGGGGGGGGAAPAKKQVNGGPLATGGRTLVPGDPVAALTTSDGQEVWIVAKFQAWNEAEEKYDVLDDEADDGIKTRYFLPPHRIIPLPKTGTPILPVGSFVLAVYPETTTFYKGTVIAPARRIGNGEYSDYTVEFEEDDSEGGRLVKFQFVVGDPSQG